VRRIVLVISGDLDVDGDPVDVLDALAEAVMDPLELVDFETDEDLVPVPDDVELLELVTDDVPVLDDVTVLVDVPEVVKVLVDVKEFVTTADALCDLDIVLDLVDVIEAVVVLVDVLDKDAADEGSVERVSVDVFVDVLEEVAESESITPVVRRVRPLGLYSSNASILKSEGGVDPIIPIPNKSNNHRIPIL